MQLYVQQVFSSIKGIESASKGFLAKNEPLRSDICSEYCTAAIDRNDFRFCSFDSLGMESGHFSKSKRGLVITPASLVWAKILRLLFGRQVDKS